MTTQVMTERAGARPRRLGAARAFARAFATALLVLPAAQLGGAGDARAQEARGRAAPVEVTRAEERPIPERVELSGSVVSPRAARVSTEVGGLVQAVEVALGQRVQARQPLVQLDATLAALELKSAEAATEEAREALRDARREVEVGRQLAERSTLPRNEQDARQAQARIAGAAVERLEAEEARLRARVERHTILAPFAGVIAERAATEGEWVSPGTAVVELVETERLRVDVPVPQRHFPELGEAPGVTVRFDAFPGRAFPAAVLARVPVSDPTARTFTLRLDPEVGDAGLTPGMSARVTLELGSERRGVVVPRDAVIRYPDRRTTVWTLVEGDEGPTASERLVELGRAFDGRVQVLEGLEAGTEVVVRGNEALSEGQPVRRVDSGTG